MAAMSGCGAVSTALKYKDLEVQTKMSDTIFTDPVPPAKRVVWIDLRNTSDQEIDLTTVRDLLQSKGFRVIEDPDRAEFHLQVNTLYVGKASQAAIDRAVAGGFGSAIAGAATGAAIGGLAGGYRGAGTGALVGGLVVGGAELIAGSLVKAVRYAVITDVQLSQRSAVMVAQRQQARLRQGSSTVVSQDVSETSPWKRYRTRIVSTATQVNLDFADAKPVLTGGLIRSIVGLL